MRYVPTIALIIAFSISAFGQGGYIGPKGYVGPSGYIGATPGLPGGTFSTRNVGNCATGSGANTCSISLAAVAGDLDIFACYNPSSGVTTPPIITSVSSAVIATGNLQFTTASEVGSYGTGVVNTTQSFAYVLPANSGSKTSPVVITLANNASSAGGNCYLAELTPSANGSLVGLATDFAYQPTADGTNFTQHNVTTNGTNEAFYQGFMGTDGYVGATAAASPYNTNGYFPLYMAFSEAPNPGNGNGAAWTNASVTPVMQTIGFSWSPSAFVPQQFQGFEGGTAGNAPTAATLAAGSQGWNGCQWVITADTLKYATDASLPLLNNMGLLGDGSTVSAGAGALGLEATSTGTLLGLVQCQATQSNTQNMILAVKFNDNVGASDNSSCDCISIHGANNGDYAGFNDYGTGASRNWGLETNEGNGTHSNISGGTTATECGTSAGQGCTVVLFYNSNSGGITATSVTAAVAGGTVTFTGTFTPSLWPAGFAFSPSGCTGGTNYNGQMFFVATSSASTVTASSTSYTNGGTTAATSGSPTTCTLTGQHAMLAYDHTGALFLASFHAGATSNGPLSYWDVGETLHNITSSDVFKWDSVQFSFNNTAPSL